MIASYFLRLNLPRHKLLQCKPSHTNHLNGTVCLQVSHVHYSLLAAVDQEVSRTFHKTEQLLSTKTKSHQRTEPSVLTCFTKKGYITTECEGTTCYTHFHRPWRYNTAVNAAVTFTAGWLYTVTLSGKTITSSTSRNSTEVNKPDAA